MQLNFCAPLISRDISCIYVLKVSMQLFRLLWTTNLIIYVNFAFEFLCSINFIWHLPTYLSYLFIYIVTQDWNYRNPQRDTLKTLFLQLPPWRVALQSLCIINFTSYFLLLPRYLLPTTETLEIIKERLQNWYIFVLKNCFLNYGLKKLI